MSTDRGGTWSVADFGAVGDGENDDTWAFEEAIADIREHGGGTLVVSGVGEGVYMIRPINLTSHMELFLEAGVTIRSLPANDPDDWPLIPWLPSYGRGRDHPGPRRTSLIHGEHLVNVTIRGEDPQTSVLDGNGQAWWDRRIDKTEWHTRGHLVEFLYSSDITLDTIRLINSPFWTIHPYDCENVTITNVHVRNPLHSPNTDGFDPDSSRNVLIEDSSYEGGDDCVAVKSGWDCFGIDYAKPSSNILIRNLTCHSGQVSIGSETSGGIHDVTVEGLFFPGVAWHAFKIKTGKFRGAFIRNITVRNVAVTGRLDGPALFVDATLYDDPFHDRNPSCPAGWRPPHPAVVEDVVAEDWDAAAANFTGTNSVLLKGLPGSPLTRLSLQNLSLPDPPNGKQGWVCSRIANSTADHRTVTPWPPCKELGVVAVVGASRGGAWAESELPGAHNYAPPEWWRRPTTMVGMVAMMMAAMRARKKHGKPR